MDFITDGTRLTLDASARIIHAGSPAENLIREPVPFAQLSFYTPAPAFTNEWVRPWPAEAPVTADAVAAEGGPDAFTVRFSDGAEADFTCRAEPAALVFTLREVRSAGRLPTRVHFACMALRTDADRAVALMPLNPETLSFALPGAAPRHEAVALSRLGLRGASCAVFTEPWAGLRARLQTVTKALTERIPWLPCAGAFAQDAPEMQGSYMMVYGGYLPGSLCPQNLDRWLRMLREIGLTQVDFHGAEDKNFTFGAFEPNPAIYPEGRRSLAEVTAKLRENGISSIFHTYSSQISPGSPLVTPVPDPRLGYNRVFTLREDVGEADTAFPIEEPTDDVSLVHTGHYNSSRWVVWDDEIVEFRATGTRALTEVVRGIFGTRPAPHARGTKGRNLKRMYNILLPDAGGTLYRQVAANTAEAAESLGFTAFYFDALEAVDKLEGSELLDYYCADFVYQVASRLHAPAGMEMSHMNAGLWYVRSRMGAWDRPSCAQKAFLERHAAGGALAQKLCTLPQNLGWWYFGENKPGPAAGTDRLTTDVYETIGRLAAAHDFSMSFQGLTDTAYFACEDLPRFASMVKRWETLRLSGTLTDAQKARLAEGECHMEDGQIYPTRLRQTAVTFRDGRAEAVLSNPFGAQVPYLLRFEALECRGAASAPAEFDTNALVEPDSREFTGGAAFPDPVSDTPVFFPDYETRVIPTRTVTASAAWEDSPHGRALRLTACAAGPLGCARAQQSFSRPLNIRGQYGFGVWIEGDASGAVLDFELRCRRLESGQMLHKPVVVDFTGWRYFELIECGAAQVMAYRWPFYMGLRAESEEFEPLGYDRIPNDWPDSMYLEEAVLDRNANPHHITGGYINDRRVSYASVWINNLPQGKPCTVRIAGWHAFFTESRNVAALRMGDIAVDTLPAGSIAEFSDGSWFTAGPDSRPVGHAAGALPALASGENRLTLTADVPDGTRLRVTAGLRDLSDPVL